LVNDGKKNWGVAALWSNGGGWKGWLVLPAEECLSNRGRRQGGGTLPRLLRPRPSETFSPLTRRYSKGKTLYDTKRIGFPNKGKKGKGRETCTGGNWSPNSGERFLKLLGGDISKKKRRGRKERKILEAAGGW